MKLKSPHITLLVGLVLAIVLLILSANAARQAPGYGYSASNNTPTTAAAATTAAAPTTAPATTAPAVLGQATFAARVDGGTSTVGIAVHNGQAIAYLCDGKKIEAWLQGTAAGGQLTMTGKNGASLTGTYTTTGATGQVNAAGKTWTFKAPPVSKPSGLYRATAVIRNAKIVGGWIILADGTQVGIVTSNGVPTTAPMLDTTTLTATVDGSTVTAAAVDPTTFEGN
jgi:serine/threonine-protein kinase